MTSRLWPISRLGTCSRCHKDSEVFAVGGNMTARWYCGLCVGAALESSIEAQQ